MYNSFSMFGGALVGTSTVITIVYAVILVGVVASQYVATCMIFIKAGEAPWKCLIPMYSTYILFRMSWKTKMFIPYACVTGGWLVGLIGFALSFISFMSGLYYYSSYYNYDMSGAGLSTFFMLLMFACSIAMVVFTVMLYYHVAKSFGKDGGFMVGLVLLNVVFMMILAFGQARYLGNLSAVKRQPEPNYYLRPEEEQPKEIKEPEQE